MKAEVGLDNNNPTITLNPETEIENDIIEMFIKSDLSKNNKEIRVSGYGTCLKESSNLHWNHLNLTVRDLVKKK